jgi:hypothetical protein
MSKTHARELNRTHQWHLLSTGSHMSQDSAMILQDSSRESPPGLWLVETGSNALALHCAAHPTLF